MKKDFYKELEEAFMKQWQEQELAIWLWGHERFLERFRKN